MEKQQYTKGEIAIINHYLTADIVEIFKDRLKSIDKDIAYVLEENNLQEIEKIALLLEKIPCEQERVAQKMKLIRHIEKMEKKYKYSKLRRNKIST